MSYVLFVNMYAYSTTKICQLEHIGLQGEHAARIVRNSTCDQSSKASNAMEASLHGGPQDRQVRSTETSGP